MTNDTAKLFLDDAYKQSEQAVVTSINERGGILLDRTIFYANSGGQPGDSGTLSRSNGEQISVATTVYDDQRGIVHVPTEPVDLTIGETVTQTLDWSTRHKHMRAHTCLHLLCALIPFPVTGGQISTDGGRLDFDIPEATLDKSALTVQLNELIDADHPVSHIWVDESELDANPALVRTMAVKPPRGEGSVRLVLVNDGQIDRQPCGGTHVRSTGEIGPVRVTKIEKKGRQNRRVRIALDAIIE